MKNAGILSAVVIGVFGLLALAMVLNGFMLSYMWQWFVVPLGVRPIGLPQAIGIAIIVSMLTSEAEMKTDPRRPGRCAPPPLVNRTMFHGFGPAGECQLSQGAHYDKARTPANARPVAGQVLDRAQPRRVAASRERQSRRSNEGRSLTYPIPDAALDDRLGWIGTSGSGKTYNASAGVERLLGVGARVVIVDPLGVWWGLRLKADGSPSNYNVVIFGGDHGDLPLNEGAGALIGETVAGMGESCIVDLSALTTKSAERRFMLAFLEAVYRHTDARKVDPYHVVFDEADLWAPQKSSEPMLQSRMEEIVRRGRIRGFIPWLITQRPAVLSKDVLSQVDGLVAFKLTASQDRKAIGDWVKGQADEGQWSAIDASLPTLQRGTGIVWAPSRGILTTTEFPAKQTFDSSRTPQRGERVERRDLKPLDLDKLKGRLSSIEEEAGREKAEVPDAPPTGEELRRRVLGKLAGPQQRILSVLIEAYPDAVTNEECAGKAGYSETSSGYKNPRGNLKALNLANYPSPGQVRAADWLFP
jgi:hypothetical protein